jgi:hypothetical protein
MYIYSWMRVNVMTLTYSVATKLKASTTVITHDANTTHRLKGPSSSDEKVRQLTRSVEYKLRTQA